MYHDLIYSNVTEGKQNGFAQIYLPTHEIAARVLSTLPKYLRFFLSQMPKISIRFLKHIGIVMIFHPGTQKQETKVEISRKSKIIYKAIKLRMMKCGFLLIKRPSQYLLNEKSMHLGSIGLKLQQSGIRNPDIVKLRKSQVYVVDTSILPSIPPGPLTAISAAYSRLIVRSALEDN